MCTDTQYPSVVKEEPAFLCTVSVYSLVYPVYVRVRLNICKIRDQPPLTVYNRSKYTTTYGSEAEGQSTDEESSVKTVDGPTVAEWLREVSGLCVSL